MPPFPRRACAAVLVLCASLLGAVAPASAAEDPAARLVVPETVEVKTATGSEGLEAGTRYWELDVEPLGVGYADYVGSWENVDGMWESPDAVHDYFARGGLVETLENRRECTFQGLSERLFSKMDADVFAETYGDAEGNWTAPEMLQWDVAEECETLYALEKGGWDRGRAAWSVDPSSFRAEVRIPLSVIGPGEHDIFIAPFAFETSDDECVFEWPDGDWVSWGCSFRWLPSTHVTVTVPDPDAAPDRGVLGMVLIGAAALLAIALIAVLAALIVNRRRAASAEG